MKTPTYNYAKYFGIMVSLNNNDVIKFKIMMDILY